MKKLTILIAISLLAACSPKKSSVKANVATVAGAPLTQCTSTMGVSSTNVGTIYDNQNPMGFENQVKSFLSATTNPNEVGSISSQGNAQTGVRFNGQVKLDAAGNVVSSQAKVNITVYDSIWLMDQMNVQPIKMDFVNGINSVSITGQFNTSTGDGTLVIKDQYGEIRFQGRMDAQNFSGTVSFQNSTSVFQGGALAAGTLGQFFIQRCAMFQ